LVIDKSTPLRDCTLGGRNDVSKEYLFRIAGSYSPATIPLARLGEYLEALGELLGEPANVHFRAIEEGSTVARVMVDHPAAPKVDGRLESLSRGDASEQLSKAYRRIDEMLRADNATGELVGANDNPVRIDFPGRDRPEAITYGPVKQVGVVDGEIFRIEGRDATVHVGVLDGERTYSLDAPAALAQQLAQYFRAGPIRFRGEGTWFRQGNGAWELRRFKIDAFEALDDSPLSAAVGELRKVGPGEWGLAADPIAELLSERRRGDSRH
jgi:hypothetical protein